jgi:hypothetical protein
VFLFSWLCCLMQMCLSNKELTLLAILTLRHHGLGNKAFIAALGYIGSTSLKISHPCGPPLLGKEYGPC